MRWIPSHICICVGVSYMIQPTLKGYCKILTLNPFESGSNYMCIWVKVYPSKITPLLLHTCCLCFTAFYASPKAILLSTTQPDSHDASVSSGFKGGFDGLTRTRHSCLENRRNFSGALRYKFHILSLVYRTHGLQQRPRSCNFFKHVYQPVFFVVVFFVEKILLFKRSK